jgi:hypothetical protein
MLEVINIRVRSFDLSYLDVYWDIKPSFEDILNFDFVVEKSRSEFGPYRDVHNPVINSFHIRDNTVKGQHSFYNKLWYRVRVRNRETGEEESWPKLGGAKLAALPDLAALEMARINNLKLKEFSGRKVWIFPKKTSGQRCPICFDEVSQRRLRSSCLNCFDTGWVGGYNAPVESYGMVITPNEATTHAPFGDMQTENTSILLGNYPELFEGDIIIEAENIRWRVGSNIGKVNKARALVRQQAPIHHIPKSDMEYSLPMNLGADEIRELQASPERNYTNPQTLESDKLVKALNNVFGN